MNSTPRQLRRTYLVGLALFVVTMLALTSYALWRLRSDAIENGLHVSTLHVRSIENFLTQSLHVTEQIAANLGLTHKAAEDSKRMQETFVTTMRQAPFLRSISLQDSAGKIVSSSNPANVGTQVSTQAYLPPDSGGHEILRIGQPWQGRDFADGKVTTPQSPAQADAQTFIPVARAMSGSGPGHTILIAINPDYFVNQMSESLAAQAGQVEVLRYDGVLMMSTEAKARAGASLAQVVQNLQLMNAESGAFEESTAGAPSGLTAFRTSVLYPLVVITRLDREDALRQWQIEVKTLVGVLVPTLLGVFLMGSLSYSRQREAAAQRELAQRARDDALNRLKRIASRVPGVLFEFRLRPDGSASFPYASDAILAMYGNRISPEDIKNDASDLFELIYAEDLPGLLASIRDSANQLALWQYEYRISLQDGVIRWLHGSSIPEQEADGSILWHGFISDITERKFAESAMNELNRDFVSFLENTSDFIYFKDKDSRFRFASQTLANITGHASWRAMIGKNDSEVFPAETAKIYQDEEVPIFRDGKPLLNKVDPYFDEFGNKGWVSTNKWPLVDENGKILGLFGISRDITAHKQNEAKLELAASVFHNSREGIMITETDGTIIDVNEAFSLITGYSREEIVGQNPRVLGSGRQTTTYYAAMWEGLKTRGHWYGEVWNRRKNGEVYAEMQTISTVYDIEGKPQRYVSLFSDISAAKEHELQLEHIAHYDTLTNLPNRSLLADRLAQSMAQSLRRGKKLAVVFLDLDGFKLVNDKHGHEAGDQLLMTVSARMKQALREGDTLARIGGDEFVAVLVDMSDATECLPILRRLLDAAAQPMPFGDGLVQVSASLGVTFYPQFDEIDADQLQRQADQAMYQAKVMGKNRYHFFDAEHDRNVRGHHESLEHIRNALLQDEFVLYYQPKVNMRTGKVIGAEALIRWRHPKRGLLAPGLFLPAIENHALAIDVGEWVIRTALTQIQDWRQAGLDLPVSVNVGARQLQQHDFVARLELLLNERPDRRIGDLELEVLETSALEDISGVSRLIEACRALGVLFALDDFGTGYSSLTYLKRLPVALLKIDQSFVKDMLEDVDNLAILKATIGLAKAFHREVIAEGVETVEHGTNLLQMGCELAQGYGIARPMPASDMPAWVHAWKPDAAWSGCQP